MGGTTIFSRISRRDLCLPFGPRLSSPVLLASESEEPEECSSSSFSSSPSFLFSPALPLRMFFSRPKRLPRAFNEVRSLVFGASARARPALAFLLLFSILRATAAPFSRAPLFLRCNARCFNSCKLLDVEALDDIACDGCVGCAGSAGRGWERASGSYSSWGLCAISN